jgi:hypothetical protein
VNQLFLDETKGSGADFIFFESVSRTGQARRVNSNP